MPKQNHATEEDYLDNLLSSVLSSTGDGELKDDIFDEELKDIMGSDEDFFSSIEKDWMEDANVSELPKEDATPETIAKETFEKYKDPVTEEYRDVPPELASYPPEPQKAENIPPEPQEAESISPEPQENAYTKESPAESEETAYTRESLTDAAEERADAYKENMAEPQESKTADDIAEEDMKGLMDILGVPEENEEQKQEIADLENKNTKRRKKNKEKNKEKKEKSKKGLFGKKNKEETPQERNLDVALDLMEKGSQTAEEAEQTLSDTEETILPEDVLGSGTPEGEETQSIDSLITDLGLGEGLSSVDESGAGGDADAEAEAAPKEKKKEKKKKEKKPKKAKKDKKSKKAKKPKREKKPKKEKAPKAPDEIIAIPIPFLLFCLSIGAFIVLAATFGGHYNNYQTSVNNATSYYIDQKYGKAYNELYGLEMKKGDEYFFHQVETVGYVYRNYEAYQRLAELGNYQDALDSLLNGVRMFDKYKDIGRDKYNCYEDMNTVLGWITAALQDVYGITESDAREINLLGRNQHYSYRVAEIASEVQIQEGSQTDDSNN